jgi:hypothetical protein
LKELESAPSQPMALLEHFGSLTYGVERSNAASAVRSGTPFMGPNRTGWGIFSRRRKQLALENAAVHQQLAVFSTMNSPNRSAETECFGLL